jgi:hypothetical protein
MSVLFSLLAACSAIGAEYLYRTLRGPWWRYLWLWTPMQLLTGYCIYRLVTVPGAPLVGALILWSFATIGVRTALSYFILHDRIPAGTWAALGLMVVARALQTYWK